MLIFANSVSTISATSSKIIRFENQVPSAVKRSYKVKVFTPQPLIIIRKRKHTGSLYTVVFWLNRIIHYGFTAYHFHGGFRVVYWSPKCNQMFRKMK